MGICRRKSLETYDNWSVFCTTDSCQTLNTKCSRWTWVTLRILVQQLPSTPSSQIIESRGILRICVENVDCWDPPLPCCHLLSIVAFSSPSLTFAKFPSCFCGICWIPPTGRWVNKATPDSGDYTWKSTWKVNRASSWYFGHLRGRFKWLHLEIILESQQIHPRQLHQIILEMMAKLNNEGRAFLDGQVHVTLGQWLCLS